ncbi:MAG: hypothetical protein ACM3ZQ_03400 [Bacillota bacterium]
MRYVEPSPERQEEMIEQLAQKVSQYGMEVPAVFFGEMSKPLSFIYSQGLHFATPFLGVFFDEDKVQEYAYLLEDRNNLERFLTRVEELAHEADRRKKWGL